MFPKIFYSILPKRQSTGRDFTTIFFQRVFLKAGKFMQNLERAQKMLKMSIKDFNAFSRLAV